MVEGDENSFRCQEFNSRVQRQSKFLKEPEDARRLPLCPTIRNGSEIFREAKKGPNSGNWACTSFYLVVRTTCSRVLISERDQQRSYDEIDAFFPPLAIDSTAFIYIYARARAHTHTVILLRPFYRAAAELLLHYRSSGENKTSKLHLQLTVRAIERSIPPSHRFISPRSLVFDSSTRLVKIKVRIERKNASLRSIAPIHHRHRRSASALSISP